MFKGGIPYIFQFFFAFIIQGESSFSARTKTPTSNRFKILKKFRNSGLCTLYSILNLVVGRKILLHIMSD
jgi:hypothetical protein